MKPTYWIIAALGLIIALLILFDKDPEPDTTRWKQEITKQEERVKALEGNLATIREKVKADSLQGVKSKQEYEVKVSSLRSTVAKLKANPRVIEVLKANPEVDRLVIAQDSVIQASGTRIVELESEMKDLRVNMDSVNDTFEEILQAERTKFEASQSMNKDLEKQVKKEKRKGKLAKVLLPIVGVGALLLGTAL